MGAIKKSYVSFLIPLAGMGLFVLFYVIASLQYPGGSHANPNAVGFSFWNNYLCDLLDVHTVGGVLNPGRHYSRIALFVLCSSLMLLWFFLPKLFKRKKGYPTLVRTSGLASLIVMLFMTAGNHDMVVRVAGILGVIALVLLMDGLLRSGYHKLFGLGILCLFVFLVNYYIYETGTHIKTLPVIQKFTFLLFIAWFVLLDVATYRQTKSK